MSMVHFVPTSATWVVCTGPHLDLWAKNAAKSVRSEEKNSVRNITANTEFREEGGGRVAPGAGGGIPLQPVEEKIFTLQAMKDGTLEQVTVPSTRVHSRVPACPVQQHRNSSDALAICQPRHMAIAVIKMFPGTADYALYTEHDAIWLNFTLSFPKLLCLLTPQPQAAQGKWGLRIIESFSLEKTFKIIESNCKPNPAKSTTKPCL
ncbi:hypothetical protein QYF61_004285 [Mycteria americana]|uniref:Uncharacterized protein n=1 Tax=Mycteria americana TaxID=33587 RepID=A0AAN7N881_MYCAM|nr:hypothetical protein QYF61_004285 [Mycteria americana]